MNKKNVYKKERKKMMRRNILAAIHLLPSTSIRAVLIQSAFIWQLDGWWWSIQSWRRRRKGEREREREKEGGELENMEIRIQVIGVCYRYWKSTVVLRWGVLEEVSIHHQWQPGTGRRRRGGGRVFSISHNNELKNSLKYSSHFHLPFR